MQLIKKPASKQIMKTIDSHQGGNKKRNLIIAVSVVAVLLIGGVGVGAAIHAHNQQVQATQLAEKKAKQKQYDAKIKKELAQINSKYTTLTQAATRDARFTEFKHFLAASKAYANGKSPDHKVTARYVKLVKQARQYFKALDAKTLAENTVDAATTTDKINLTAKSANLTELQKLIDVETPSVYTKAEAKTNTDKINKLAKSYATRVVAIDDAEKQAAAASAAQQAAANKAVATNGTTSTTNGATGNSYTASATDSGYGTVNSSGSANPSSSNSANGNTSANTSGTSGNTIVLDRTQTFNGNTFRSMDTRTQNPDGSYSVTNKDGQGVGGGFSFNN